MIRRAILPLLALLALAGCARTIETVTPALWEVTGPDGERGWLLGTIHALEEPVAWRSKAVETALVSSDRLAMEIGNADEPAAIGKLFAALATSPGHGPPASRIEPQDRPALARLLEKFDLADDDFSSQETWALALTLARHAQGSADTEYGMEAALMQAAMGKPVVELEGAAPQLRLFDSLPEAEQRDLLAAVIEEAAAPQDNRLEIAWKRGDMAAIERETRTGMLADPELRAVLFTTRNQVWADKVSAMLKRGDHPLVAVGAAHMAGPEGLPALLAARGLTVRRVQ